MKTIAAFAALALSGALAGCGGTSPSAQPAQAAHRSAAPKPAAAGVCKLKQKRDLIVRMVVPHLPPAAEVLGDVDYGNCRSTLETLPNASPHDPGYCTQIAWASDNRGYKADATPAARLKKVILAIGPAC